MTANCILIGLIIVFTILFIVSLIENLAIKMDNKENKKKLIKITRTLYDIIFTLSLVALSYIIGLLITNIYLI